MWKGTTELKRLSTDPQTVQSGPTHYLIHLSQFQTLAIVLDRINVANPQGTFSLKILHFRIEE